MGFSISARGPSYFSKIVILQKASNTNFVPKPATCKLDQIENYEGPRAEIEKPTEHQIYWEPSRRGNPNPHWSFYKLYMAIFD